MRLTTFGRAAPRFCTLAFTFFPLALGACGGVPMSDVRPLAVSLPTDDARVFEQLTDLFAALGYDVLDADASNGVFTVSSRRWASSGEEVRYVVQCTRDGFATITVERHRGDATARIELHRPGGSLHLPREVADEYRELALAMRERLHPDLARATEAAMPTPGPEVSSVAGWPVSPGQRPDAIIDPHVHEGRDEGRIIAGATTFALGFLGSIIVAAVGEATGSCVIDQPGTTADVRVGCASWGFSLVPIAGTLAASLTAFSYGERRDSTEFWADLPLVTMQLVGFGLLMYAIGAPTTDLREGAPIGAARLRFEPSAPSAQIGASAVIDF